MVNYANDNPFMPPLPPQRNNNDANMVVDNPKPSTFDEYMDIARDDEECALPLSQLIDKTNEDYNYEWMKSTIFKKRDRSRIIRIIRKCTIVGVMVLIIGLFMYLSIIYMKPDYIVYNQQGKTSQSQQMEQQPSEEQSQPQAAESEQNGDQQ